MGGVVLLILEKKKRSNRSKLIRKAEVKGSWYPQWSKVGLQEGKFEEANDKMLHFKLTIPGSIYHVHGWMMAGEASLKWRKIHIKSDIQENEALADRQSYIFLVIKILQGAQRLIWALSYKSPSWELTASSIFTLWWYIVAWCLFLIMFPLMKD